MSKEIQVGLRMDQQTNDRLEEMAKIMFRTKSDMVRWLVNREYEKLNPQSNNGKWGKSEIEDEVSQSNGSVS